MNKDEAILFEILQEREAQDQKWGEQNHRNGTHQSFSGSRDMFRNVCDTRHKMGQGTWVDILREEAYEAFAEEDPTALRKELVQVAAVAVAWIGAIDRAQP